MKIQIRKQMITVIQAKIRIAMKIQIVILVRMKIVMKTKIKTHKTEIHQLINSNQIIIMPQPSQITKILNNRNLIIINN